MEDNHKSPKDIASRIIRERAMRILKDTRAGMDPAFLEKMARQYAELLPGKAKPEPKIEAAIIPPPSQKPPVDIASETVDKEKIRQIVLDYMAKRDDKPRH